MPTLPAAPQPQGRYRAACVAGGLVLTAGMTPRVDGTMQYAGRVGEEVTEAQAREAAALAARNALSAAAEAAGGLDAVRQVARMTVYVNAADGFVRHSAVADGASSALAEVLGEGPRSAAVRSAVGVASLPGGACVEVELTCLL